MSIPKEYKESFALSLEDFLEAKETIILYLVREELEEDEDSARENFEGEVLQTGIVSLASTTDENEKMGIEVYYDFNTGHFKTYVSELDKDGNVVINNYTLVNDEPGEIDSWMDFDSLVSDFDTETGVYGEDAA